MKHLTQLVVICAAMAAALLLFCPSAKASVLPVVELDARDAMAAQADGPIPVCVVDTHANGKLSTLVYPASCADIIPMLKADQADERKQAIIYLTINGQHINLI
jgi:hypothetical protein